MKSELAAYFERVRMEKEIGLGELARLCGYRNVSKGANKIQRFVALNEVHCTLLTKLAAALEIEDLTVSRLIQEDRQRWLQEWTAWADTPIMPSVVLSHIGGFVCSEPVPAGLSREAAEEYAADMAKEMRKPICLILSRRLSIWFDREGNRTSVKEAKPGDVGPYLRFGRRKVIGIMKSLLTLADFHLGIEQVLDSHDVFLDDRRIVVLRDSLDFDAMKRLLSGSDQSQQLLGLIEDQLLRLGVVSGKKKF